MKEIVENISAGLKHVRSRFGIRDQAFARSFDYISTILADRYSAFYDFSIASRQLLSLAETIESHVKGATCLSDRGKALALFNASELCVLAADIEVSVLRRDAKGALALEQAVRLLPQQTPGKFSGKKICGTFNFERRWRLMQEQISRLNESANFYQHAIDAERRLIEYFSNSSTVEFCERDPSMLTLISRFQYTDLRRLRIENLTESQTQYDLFSKAGHFLCKSTQIKQQAPKLPKPPLPLPPPPALPSNPPQRSAKVYEKSDFQILQASAANTLTRSTSTNFLPTDFLEMHDLDHQWDTVSNWQPTEKEENEVLDWSE